MKKVIIFLGALFTAALIAMITIPFFVDVDQYRPQILQMANEQINGKLDLGKLKLSLIGGVKIKAESINLKVNGFEKTLIEADHFYLEIPFTSILAAKPAIVAVMAKPKINIEKKLNGDMNLMKLMKQTTAKAAPQENTNRKVASTEAPGKIPAFVAAAAFGLKIEKGSLNYDDKLTKSIYKLQDLDMDVRNLGLSSKMSFSINAPMEGSAPSMKFHGVVKGDGHITPVLVDNAIRSATGLIELDASKLNLNASNGMFIKTDSMPLIIKMSFDGTEKDLLIKNIEAKLYDYRIFAKGLVTMVPSINARIEVNSDPLILDKLDEMVPMLKQYKLKGIVTMLSNIESDGTKLKVNGEMKVNEGEVSMPGVLKAPLKFMMQTSFTENSLSIAKGNLSAPDSDLTLIGKIVNFAAPQFSFSLNGKSFNLDKFLVFEEKTASLNIISTAVAANAKDAKPVEISPMADFAKNPMFVNASGSFGAQIAKVVAKGATMENINVKAVLNPGLQLKLVSASLKTFGGQVSSTGDFDLKSPQLVYKTQGKVSGLSAKDAFTAYFPKYKNTLEGTADADWNLTGRAYPETMRMKAMSGTVKISAKDGILKTADFKDSISGVIQKVPFLKNTKAPDIEEGFKLFKADMLFKDGVIKIEPIQMLGKGPKSVDIKGKSTVQENFTQDTYFDVYDPNGLLPKEISKPNQVAIPLHIAGNLMSPQTDYEYTVKKLASSAVKNIVSKDNLQKGLGKILGGSDDGKPSGGAKNIGDQLKKKFKLPF